MYKAFAIALLSILVISLLPHIAIVGAGTDFDVPRIDLPLAQLTPPPPAAGEGPIIRPPASSDDIIVQYGDSHEDVGAQSDNSGVEIVPAAAFVHTGELDNVTQGEDWFFAFFGGYVVNASGNVVCLAAPVYLPPGSVMESFTAYVYDNSASDNIWIFFDRSGSWGGGDELARAMSTGSSTSIQIITDPSITSDNGANVVAPFYNYHVDVCFPPDSFFDIRVLGARVDYSYPADVGKVYLPILLKQLPSKTRLHIKNGSGGVIDYYRIFDSPGGTLLAKCPTGIPNGATVDCGTFNFGTRHVVTDGECGPGSGNVDFPEGTCTRTVRCGRDNPTTMVCN
jgi:hypothetical protein